MITHLEVHFFNHHLSYICTHIFPSLTLFSLTSLRISIFLLWSTSQHKFCEEPSNIDRMTKGHPSTGHPRQMLHTPFLSRLRAGGGWGKPTRVLIITFPGFDSDPRRSTVIREGHDPLIVGIDGPRSSPLGLFPVSLIFTALKDRREILEHFFPKVQEDGRCESVLQNNRRKRIRSGYGNLGVSFLAVTLPIPHSSETEIAEPGIQAASGGPRGCDPVRRHPVLWIRSDS